MSKNQGITENPDFDVSNNEIWILLFQNEAGKSIKILKILFKDHFTIKMQKNAITIMAFFLWVFLGDFQRNIINVRYPENE